MSFFEVPDVYYKHLWPLLTWNELLRIRRVCKGGKREVDSYLIGNPERVPEIRIDEEKKSLDKFLKLNLEFPITKLFFANSTSGPFYFENYQPLLKRFLNKHAVSIKKLRLSILCALPICKEREFLERLENFEALHATTWVSVPNALRREYVNLVNTIQGIDRYPKVFRQLKDINIGIKDAWRQLENLNNIVLSSAEFVHPGLCPNLESLAVPFASSCQEIDDYIDRPIVPTEYYTLATLLHFFHRDIFGDVNRRVPRHQKLKKLSFEHFYEAQKIKPRNLQRGIDEFASNVFVKFLYQASKTDGFSLEMVNASWFMDVYEILKGNPGHCIRSMVNIHPSAIEFVTMDNLTHLDITSSSSCVVKYSNEFLRPDNRCQRNITIARRPTWSVLKSIKIVIDSDLMDDARACTLRPNGFFATINFPPVPVSHLFKFLFHDTSTESLFELCLDFQQVSKACKPTEEMVTEIVSSCPNIKKLWLTGWTGTNKSLIRFWEGLPYLAELTLERCPSIGNVGFVGEDISNPVFLRLSSMRRLSLLALDEMPKITDTSFRMVLNRMELSTLVISSGGPLRSVTVSGVRSLLDGKFAKYVERFPFHGWSILNCSADKFERLEREFRSYNMI